MKLLILKNMDIVLTFALIAIAIGSILMFIEFTTDYFYSSAIIDLFLFNHKKWKLYRKAKKQEVKRYLTQMDYENDYYNNCVPDFYLYPLVQKNGGIKYDFYTKDYEFITDNFWLISKL